ncbi:MAG: TetR/AcrR family transcriptional regulator [Candidatus Rokubacteria bacterium]|nr:TetR/AcrR family transcriptional regulator [Candidatus Rokubacteria bacterium]
MATPPDTASTSSGVKRQSAPRRRSADGGRSSRRSFNSRRHILDAAAHLFSSQGYSATTLRQVATKARIKAGSIYYHFDSKEQIMAEVLSIAVRITHDSVKQAVDALPPDASHQRRVEMAIRTHLLILHRHRRYTAANVRFHGQVPRRVDRLVQGARDAYSAYWNTLLRQAQEAGEIRSDFSLSVLRLFILGSLNRTVEWVNPRKGPIERLADQYVAVFLEGMGRLPRCGPERRGIKESV